MATKLSSEAILRIRNALDHCRLAEELLARLAADQHLPVVSDTRMQVYRALNSFQDAGRCLIIGLQQGGVDSGN